MINVIACNVAFCKLCKKLLSVTAGLFSSAGQALISAEKMASWIWKSMAKERMLVKRAQRTTPILEICKRKRNDIILAYCILEVAPVLRIGLLVHFRNLYLPLRIARYMFWSWRYPIIIPQCVIRHATVISMFRIVLGDLYYGIYNGLECLTANSFVHRCLWRNPTIGTAYWRERGGGTDRERGWRENERNSA